MFNQTVVQLRRQAQRQVEANVIITSNGGVAQSVRAPNINHKVVSLMPILRCCVLEKEMLNISTNNGADQWIRSEVAYHKFVDRTGQMHRVNGKDTVKNAPLTRTNKKTIQS